MQYGFGPLAHDLMAAGLLDELRLWVHPFFLGRGDAARGDRLFRAGSAGAFTCSGTTTLASGIVILSYQAKAA